MLVDELIYDLRGQIDPNVQDSVFSLALESLEEIFLNIANNGMCSAKVELVPASVCLTITDSLRTNLAISKQVVDEFDWEDLNLAVFFKSADIDVVTFRDV